MSPLRKLRKIWLKPTKMLIINCHDLKVVAIQVADIPGFSQILIFLIPFGVCSIINFKNPFNEC